MISMGGIQSGAVIHHQLHIATGPMPVSFRVRKSRKSKPVRPTPEDDVAEVDLVIGWVDFEKGRFLELESL
jgi:hypothetical protein